MGKKNFRYCVRAVPGKGWQVWDRKRKRYWGQPHPEFATTVANWKQAVRRDHLQQMEVYP